MTTGKSETTADLIVDYIRRMLATLNNVASHFGMPLKQAHDLLVALEDDGRIQPYGRHHWKIGATVATPTDADDLAKAVREFETALPGWWWSVTHCVWTRDADCGPDARVIGMDHPHVIAFDEGFHEAHKGTLADALRSVLREAQEAIANG